MLCHSLRLSSQLLQNSVQDLQRQRFFSFQLTACMSPDDKKSKSFDNSNGSSREEVGNSVCAGIGGVSLHMLWYKAFPGPCFWGKKWWSSSPLIQEFPARPEGFEKTNWPEGAWQTGNSQKHMAQTLAAGKFNDTSPLWAEGLWLRGRLAILGYGLQFSGNAHMFGKRDGPLLKTNPKVCKTRRLAKVV